MWRGKAPFTKPKDDLAFVAPTDSDDPIRLDEVNMGVMFNGGRQFGRHGI